MNYCKSVISHFLSSLNKLEKNENELKFDRLNSSEQHIVQVQTFMATLSIPGNKRPQMK